MGQEYLTQMAVRVYKKILPLPLPPPPPSFKKLKELYNGHLYTDCLDSLTLIFYQIYFTFLIHASTHQSCFIWCICRVNYRNQFISAPQFQCALYSLDVNICFLFNIKFTYSEMTNCKYYPMSWQIRTVLITVYIFNTTPIKREDITTSLESSLVPLPQAILTLTARSNHF